MIREIRLRDFRNYLDEEVKFESGVNIFIGRNGQGKTNLLEAVYLLGMLSSFRKAEAAQMIRKGASFFAIEGAFEGGDAAELAVERDQGGWRSILADGGACRRKLDYIGLVRMVVFSPDEMALIQGSPEGRRRYLDRTFFTLRRRHLRHLKAYGRVLKQRNLLLKKGRIRPGELEVWNEELVKEGAEVVRGRLELIALLNGELGRRYAFLGDDRVTLAYAPSGYALPEAVAGPEGPEGIDIEGALREGLLKVRREEEVRRTTLAGPHRDDLSILVDGEAAKAFSSRGEMRSILLALKAAEVEMHRAAAGTDTLILLDDVASELDVGRRTALLEHLRARGEQVLITTTEEENIPLPASGEHRVFRVDKGKILH